MSDGITEARRMARKAQYLERIEIKKEDVLLDYIKLLERTIELANKPLLKSKVYKTELNSIEEKKIVLDSMLDKLDTEKQDAIRKPPREFR